MSSTSSFKSVLTLGLSLMLASTTPLNAESITSGPKPDPLVLTPPAVKSPGVVRWFGNPQTRIRRALKSSWVTDGSRMYANNEDTQGVEIWVPRKERTNPQVPELDLKGAVPLSGKWCASPDGRWLFGSISSKKMGMFRADTLEGVWQTDYDKFGEVDEVSFSQDGRYFAIAGEVKGGCEVSIIDPATGNRVRYGQVRFAQANRESYQSPYLAKEGVYLPPVYNSKRQISLMAYDNPEAKPVTSLPSMKGSKITLSPDGRWMVTWRMSGYEVLEKTGELFEKRFEGLGDIVSEGIGISGGLTTVDFSRDSNTVVISGCNMHKVIRLSDKKVLHESEKECMCGGFAPDGRTYWLNCSAFRPVDTQSWERHPENPPVNRRSVNKITFSPDGRKMAVMSGQIVEVWDAATMTIHATLSSSRVADLGDVIWAPDGQTLLGGDRNEYLRWKLPARAEAAGSSPIKGEKLFDSMASIASREQGRDRFGVSQSILLDPVTGYCLLNMNGKSDYLELRHPSKPAVVRLFKIEGKDPFPVTKGAVFRADGKEILYKGDGKSARTLFAYDLATDQLRRSNEEVSGAIAGYDAERNRLILHGGAVTIVDAATLAPLTALHPPAGREWGEPALASPDGRWLFCVMRGLEEGENRKSYAALVDLDAGKLAGYAPIPNGRAGTLAYTPDGRHLAMSHSNGLISVWNMEKFAAESPPPPDLKLGDGTPTTTPVATPSAPRSAPANPAMVTDRVIDEPFNLISGDQWKITSEAAVVGIAGKVNVGQWLVDGEPAQPLGGRTRMTTRDTGLSALIQAELAVGTKPLRIHRDLRVTGKGEAQWLDIFQNTGPENITVNVSVVAALGADAMQLRNAEDKAPTLVDGQPSVPDNTNALGASFAVGDIQHFAAMGFASAYAPLRPRYRWDASRQATLAEWTMRLKSYEQKCFAFNFVQNRAGPTEAIWSLMSKHEVESVRRMNADLLVVNVADPANEAVQSRMSARKDRDKDGALRDAMGFRWRSLARRVDGLSWEMGAQSLLGLWINGEPASYMAYVGWDIPTNATQGRDEIMESAPSQGSVRALRRTRWSAPDSSYVTLDTLRNPSAEPVQGKLELSVLALDKVVGLLDAQGAKLDASKPVPMAACGGRLAVVFAGAEQPAVLLAIGEPEAGLQATLHLTSERGLFIRYEFPLAPGESRSVAHYAAPRPLSAFNSVVDAFRDLTPEVRIAEFHPTEPSPVANWVAK